MSATPEPPPVFDIDALVLPIPGAESQGGVPLPGTLLAELNRLRRSAPAVADGGPDGKRPAPDFRAVLDDATAALINTSKDLDLVVRVVEAATQVHGPAGLRDGLRLLHRVVTDCWDWVYPVSFGARGNRVKWLNTATGAAADFPLTVQRMKLIDCGGDSFSHFDVLDPGRSADLEAALPQCKPERLVVTYAHLTDALATVRELAKELNKRLVTDDGDSSAPDLTGPPKEHDMNLGTAIRNCLQSVVQVAARRGVSLDGSSAADGAETPNQPTAAPETARAVGGSRDDLYFQLDRIAAALKRIEPHSPVPYLLERCVKLGRLPFPELMRSVLKDSAGLAELDRLLGLEQNG